MIKKIHCIGIGGAGVSAIANMTLQLGGSVSGSDIYHNSVIDDLVKKGAKVKIGKHKASNISKGTEVVVYSNAIKKNNPELLKAKKLGLILYSYPEYIGQLSNKYTTIVVSGTHGKSTTTAMLAHIFIAAGMDPTVIMGAYDNVFHSNARIGLGKYLIIEGDEYKEAFLHYQPQALIVNNIEEDHLDHYKSIDNISKAFKKLINHVTPFGLVVANADDENISRITKNINNKIVTYGFEKGAYQAKHYLQSGELTQCIVTGPENFDIDLRVPGKHNIYNALASATMALSFGISIETIKNGLKNYKGIKRRMEIIGKNKGAIIIDDYAHHPSEISATLKTVKEIYPNKNIYCVFQPHSKNRTKKLLVQFKKAFAHCDKLILTDIYDVAGRDKKENVTIKDLKEVIEKSNITVILNYKNIPKNIKKCLSSNDVVVFMGAGTITESAHQLVR